MTASARAPFTMIGCVLIAGTIAAAARADAPAGHFTVLGDGSVRDNETGLVWERAPSAAEMSQPDAMAHCASLELAGGGWRLPSILELRSIVDESRDNPAIDLSIFPGTATAPYWTSTRAARSGSYGWTIYFGNGVADHAMTTLPGRARCVR